MPRIPSKKTQRHRIIVDAVNIGMSGNKIQKLLKDLDLGVRRKTLYEELRAIKGITISKEKREKSIPKKYRKEEIGGLGKVGQIYRGSLIISSVPLHSRPFERHYLGFRLNIFSYSKNEVYSVMRSMKKQFIKMVGDKLKSFQYASEQVLGTENPKLINLTSPDYFNGRWFFAVEEKGSDIGSESGRI